MSKKTPEPKPEYQRVFVTFNNEDWQHFKALRASYPSAPSNAVVVRNSIVESAKLLQARQLAGVEESR